MESLRERAIAAYQKEKELLPYYKSVQVENWVAEEFGVECDPVVWETEWAGEVDLGEFYMFVHVFPDGVLGSLSWRCDKCGQLDTGDVPIENMADLGNALLHEREFCSKCGRSYARD